MDQQRELMAQQMVPQQMVTQQMVAQPGSVNGMSPNHQNHIQLDPQNFVAQQLMARNGMNSMLNSPGQSVQNIALQNISHGVYSPQQTPQSPQQQMTHQQQQQQQQQQQPQQQHQQMQDVIMPQSQNILEKEAELDQEHENLMSRNVNVMNPDLGAPLQSPIVMNNKPSILKATAVRSQNSLYHGSQRNIRASNQRGHMSMNQMNLNQTGPY
jgi:hypothetical protein